MNLNSFIKEVEKLGIIITDEMLDKLNTYYEFLTEYNLHTNLTAIKEKEDIYLKHFYDSLTLTKAVDLSNQKVLDIGSGAGFPGIVLKIFFPDIDLTVLDSNNKKTTFLRLLCEKLDIKVNIVNKRAEDFIKNNENSFDIVTSRAVAFMDIIISLSLPYVKKEGKLILMKGNLQNENKILENHSDELNIKDYKIINFNLPNTLDERNLVIILKCREINKLLNYNEILKQNKRWK